MRRYKVTVYIDDDCGRKHESVPIGGMVDRVLKHEFRTNSTHGREIGYTACKLVDSSTVEEVLSGPCPHCDGKGVTYDGCD